LIFSRPDVAIPHPKSATFVSAMAPHDLVSSLWRGGYMEMRCLVKQ
jgi:hypothetical protein